MKKAWKVHGTHIHSHHSNEDSLFTPYLETRINYPEKLTSDHTELVEKLERVGSMVESLGQKEGDSVSELLKEMKEYQAIMLPHLREEEEQGLPLSRAYFTPEEIGAITQKIVRSIPKVSKSRFGRNLTPTTKTNDDKFLFLRRLKWDPSSCAKVLTNSAMVL